MQGERWIWVGGWGLDPAWLSELLDRHLPTATHTVIPPCPRLVEQIDWSSYDRAGGYSLGAFLLMRQTSPPPLPTLLLAPFFAFPAEAGLGGKIPLRSLSHLSAILRRSPEKTLTGFYSIAGLKVPPALSLPYSAEDLQEGLKILTEESVSPSLAPNCRGFIGESDPLVDASHLLMLEPRLCEVKGEGHHPSALLKASITSS